VDYDDDDDDDDDDDEDDDADAYFALADIYFSTEIQFQCDWCLGSLRLWELVATLRIVPAMLAVLHHGAES